MTLNNALVSLLEATGVTGSTSFVSWDVVQQWPAGTVDRLLDAAILTTTADALSIECHGCENRCYMDVLSLPRKENQSVRAFIVCDDPEKQSEMGRLPIQLERLKQWKVTTLQIAEVLTSLLGMDSKAEEYHDQNNIRIGMIKTQNGRRWLSLIKSPLMLEVGDYRVPLDELLFFEEGVLVIDRARIEQLAEEIPSNREKEYLPSTDKREARKLNTQSMYGDWEDEYRRLRSIYPNTSSHTKNWIAVQIAKLPIAQGRDSETIRKKMRN